MNDTRPPTIGHMLFDRHGSLGMVTGSDYLAETNLYLVQIEWYIGSIILKEVYRIGDGNGTVGLSYMRMSKYNAMRQAYYNLRKINGIT